MYTISQASARTGVSVEVLRAWERRYHVVTPERTATGYRLYGEGAITRIRAMRRLVDEGWAPSVAAASLRTMDDDAVRALAEAATPASAAPTADAGELARRLVDAAAVLDAGELERVLDQMSAQGTFEHVASAFLLPALHALGDAWAEGRVDVAGEHAASHAVLRRLAAALEAAGRQPGRDDRPVLVGLPPGARHELGALAYAVSLRRAGIPVLYLGPDLPVEDWLRAARATATRGIVLGVVLDADLAPARAVATALREVSPDALVAVGGHAARTDGTDNGWLVLPAGLTMATDALVTELDRVDPRRRRIRDRSGRG